MVRRIKRTRKANNRITALLPRTLRTIEGLKKTAQKRVKYAFRNTKRAFKGFSRGINNTTSKTLKRLTYRRR